jgi:hypothetical protein
MEPRQAISTTSILTFSNRRIDKAGHTTKGFNPAPSEPWITTDPIADALGHAYIHCVLGNFNLINAIWFFCAGKIGG